MLAIPDHDTLKGLTFSPGRRKAHPHQDEPLYFAEARSFANLANCVTGKNFIHGPLLNDHIELWLQRWENYAFPPHDEEFGTCQGGFRVLFCERSQWSPPEIYMSRANFRRVCDAFDLSEETPDSFEHILGGFSNSFVSQHPDGGPSHLRVMIKGYQKGELGNFTLSLCHDFRSSWTDALVCWTDRIIRPEHYSYVDNLYESRLEHVLALLQQYPALWPHPVCLPLALLRNYCRRAEGRCHSLNTHLAELDYELGVNQAGRGRRYMSIPEGSWPEGLDFRHLTVGLHSTNNRLAFVHQASRWAVRALDFLLELEDEITIKTAEKEMPKPDVTSQIRYLKSVMIGIEDAFAALRSRTQGATNVLFNAAGQKDSRIAQAQNDIALRNNELSLKIATATKKDNIAILTFTFLTALFLPGTFIGQVLSVPTVDFLPNHDDSGASRSSHTGAIVSRYYWVYWATTVPLTIVVMACWYVWFQYQSRVWARELEMNAKPDKAD